MNTHTIEKAASDLRWSEIELKKAVIVAHARGLTWTGVGEALGITKQAAQQRFGTEYTYWADRMQRKREKPCEARNADGVRCWRMGDHDDAGRDDGDHMFTTDPYFHPDYLDAEA
ncbi:MAG: hypothetical protein K0Q52_1902 [Microbacterium sp.]|jgi:hypothetical protein|nr:hypothetical protein [Microbacterium sp.]